MKVTSTDGKLFELVNETPEDERFTDALHSTGRYLRAVRPLFQQAVGGAYVVGFQLDTNHQSPQSIRADAGREVLRSLGQLVSLGLREAAQNGHVGPNAANPQTQEQLVASLVKLQLVLDSLCEMVLQQKAVLQKMQCAHVDPLVCGVPDILTGGAR